jgi:hypothetical protein
LAVTNHYKSKISKPKQSVKSINGCWGLVEHTVNKFHGCVNQVNHWNPSGAMAANQVSLALTMSTKLREKPFQ